MKILLVDSSDPARWGGAEVWMRRSLELLAGMGHEASGLARPGSPVLASETANPWDGEVPSLRAALRSLLPDLAVALVHRDLRLLWWAGAGGARRPAVVMARHLAPRGRSWKRRFYYSRLCRALWTPSEYMRVQLEQLDGVAPARIHVIPPSIAHAEARPTPPGGEPVVLCVGRLSPEKGQDVLLEARARMRAPARVVLVGAGREEAALRARARDLGIERWVEWAGEVSDLPEWFAHAHVLVQPSRLESFGLAALEGMARGVPVVASRVGGLPEVVGEDGAAGDLVPPEDPPALAAALDALLLGDPARLERAGQAAHRRAREAFGPERERRAFQAALEGSLA